MTPQEQADCQQWLNEFDKLIAARDAGKISAAEYCRLCFELDKKYGLAEAEDADLYLIDDEEIRDEKIYDDRLAYVGG